jgi:hypothetical protein
MTPTILAVLLVLAAVLLATSHARRMVSRCPRCGERVPESLIVRHWMWCDGGKS